MAHLNLVKSNFDRISHTNEDDFDYLNRLRNRIQDLKELNKLQSTLNLN